MNIPPPGSPEADELTLIHKARNVVTAEQIARQVELEEAIAKAAAQSAEQSRVALMESLKEVFGEGDEKRDPEQMQILIRRIPLICQDVKQIHNDISTVRGDVAKINENISRVVWVVILAVVGALLKVVLIP